MRVGECFPSDSLSCLLRLLCFCSVFEIEFDKSTFLSLFPFLLFCLSTDLFFAFQKHPPSLY